MCGIAGFNFKDESLMQSMIGSIDHRGPDDHGVFSDDKVTLGHKRLSIIDLSSAGHQPMFNDDRSLAIVYNGEVYNFQNLRQELINKGHKFRSRTDTEVILRGYDAYGEDVFNKLRGMWALAIYDRRHNRIVLSRDFFGIKPLYYYHDADSLVFASESKAIITFLKKRNIKLHNSPEGLASYFVLGYTPQPLTMSQEIKKVAPGEIIEFDLASRRIVSKSLLWPQSIGVSDPKDFEMVMLESVERHLISDVPVGVFLSGGADSTLIALLLKKLNQKLKAFTVRIPGKKDADFAGKIAKFANLDHEEIVFDDDKFEEMYQKLWLMLDQPVADTSLLPSLLVSQVASKSVKVVMAGEGGDELFWGYDRHQSLMGANNILEPSKFVEWLNNRRQPTSDLYLRYLRPILRRLRHSGLKRRGDFLGLYLELTNLSNDFVSRIELHRYFERRLNGVKPEVGSFDRMFYLPDDLLYKNDFATMANTIEGRVPILDKEVYAFTNGLATEYKLSNGVSKKIVKDYLAASLPPELILRSKEGFSIPIEPFILKHHKKDIEEGIAYLLDCHIEYIDRRVLSKLLSDENYFVLISKKFPSLLFMILVFYKTTSKYQWADL
ncbi:MAG: asparagine synthase (glutamine-hydrolyzing) [bacterium]|nr:asparagine synthase (glutamine-hydrolyzing) [bacterium]